MKPKYLTSLLLAALCYPVNFVPAAEQEPATPEEASTSLKKEMVELAGRIQEKIGNGQRTEEALKEELAEFDALLERHKDDKPDDVARAVYMQAMLYFQVLGNTDKGIELIKKLKTDFPETELGQRAGDMLASLEKQKVSETVRAGLKKGSPFPDFAEQDLEGRPLSISKFKGKVVLVDFWATWCMPCVRELPNVLDAYKQYHDDGFEIVGISLDQDRDKLTSFLKKQGMTWPQYFDGKGWENKLSGKYGVTSIPATYLLDREGNIAATDLRGGELAKTVGELLKKE